MKFCECGCGQLAPIAKRTDKRCNHAKGEAIRFINHHHSLFLAHHMKGKNHPLWRGGKKVDAAGRRWIYMPGHLKATKKYVLYYILIAEKILGKAIPEKAVIHHWDENPSNDKNDNLVICENNTYHKLLHQRMRALKACGHPDWRKCWICKEYDKIDNLYTKGTIYHKHCKSEYQRADR